MVRDLAAMRPRERGRVVRELAAGEHLTPSGERVRVSRVTLDRWSRAWREGGFQALVPAAREGVPRTPAGVLELAVAPRSCINLTAPRGDRGAETSAATGRMRVADTRN